MHRTVKGLIYYAAYDIAPRVARLSYMTAELAHPATMRTPDCGRTGHGLPAQHALFLSSLGRGERLLELQLGVPGAARAALTGGASGAGGGRPAARVRLKAGPRLRSTTTAAASAAAATTAAVAVARSRAHGG